MHLNVIHNIQVRTVTLCRIPTTGFFILQATTCNTEKLRFLWYWLRLVVMLHRAGLFPLFVQSATYINSICYHLHFQVRYLDP